MSSQISSHAWAGARGSRASLGGAIISVVALMALMPLLAACGRVGALGAPGPDTTIYAATAVGAVSAIDAANGAVLWRYHGSGAIGMAVDASHRTLFLTTPDGTVAALDATTGKRDWQYEIGAGSFVQDKPYLVRSMVIAAAQLGSGGPASGSVIVALDARSGALLWRVSLPGAITGDLDIHNDRLYASVNTTNANGSAGPGAVYALRTTDGAQLWRAAAPAALAAGPVSDQTQVYAPTSLQTALALRASDGALQWNQNISASGPLSAIFANATAIYVDDGGGTMRALNKVDGSVLWTRAIPNSTTAPLPLVYTPSDGGSWVLLTSGSTPIIDALSPSDGSVVWSQEALPEMSPPVVLGGYVYEARGNELTILSLANGAYVTDFDFLLDFGRHYSPAEQADLSNIADIAVAPPPVVA